MRVRFDFELADGRLVLPVSYNYLLQSMIYCSISDKLSSFLHNKGFEYEKRVFKMFTFSKIFGNYRIRKSFSEQTQIIFDSSIYFYISSPYEQLLQEFANKMVSGTPLNLNGNRLYISSVQVLMPPAFDLGTSYIHMLSPITVKRTVSRHGNEASERGEIDGNYGENSLNNSHGKTYYFSPLEMEFSKLVKYNLIKKFMAFANYRPASNRENKEGFDEGMDLEIRPLRFSEKYNFHLVNYKGYIVKGYSGVYELLGSGELKQFAWDCGLGERNSQGFGMFEIWNGGSKYKEDLAAAVGDRAQGVEV